jgi:lipopolysaccharide transport system ATP-binding protein
LTGSRKQFKPCRSPADRLREIVFRKSYHKDFVALDNISFEVKNGETPGISGQNGAGKSTLLKILSGIVIPDRGTIRVG